MEFFGDPICLFSTCWVKSFKIRGLSPISTTSPPTLKDGAVLCLTYPEKDADDDIRTVAGGGPADGRGQVPQEEGQPARYTAHILHP